MKKLLFTFILAAAAMNINAQLVVDSLGRVGIGIDSLRSKFAIGNSGDEYTTMYCNANGSEYGLILTNLSDSAFATFGGYFSVKNTVDDCFALRGVANGNKNMNPDHCVIGTQGHAGRSYTSIGVLGGKWLSNYTPTNFAGVYGTETNEFYPSFTNYSGIYAGYFKGKVRVTNGIYATVLSPTAKASTLEQDSLTILSDRGESVADKLRRVQTVQFLRYDPTKASEKKQTSMCHLSDEDIDNMSPKELDSLIKTIGDIEPEPYLSPIQYGLAADQLKAVYPELVYEDQNGNVSINYVEMIPLLVQSINELSAKVAELEGTSSKKAKIQPTAIEETASEIDMVRMDQNKPNPFSESTVIALNIPTDTQTASIFIYDMSGKQIQSRPVTERGETNITVYAADLSAGMYIYTLVVDGKVAVTRRMIVTK